MSQLSEDKLYRCIKAFCYIENINFPGESICSGVALSQGAIDPSDVPTIVERLGITGELKQGRQSALKKINAPSIIFTKEGDCLLVVSANYAQKIIQVYDPSSEQYQVKEMTSHALKSVFSGMVIYLTNEFKMEGRASAFLSNANQENWFRQTLNQLRKTYPYVILSAIFINLLVSNVIMKFQFMDME